jgi:hypothetical protein
MNNRRWRVVAGLLLVGLVAAGVALVGGSMGPGGTSARPDPRNIEAASNFRFHELPGVADREGPTSAADEAYLERAYPADSIAFGQTQGAQSAFDDVKKGRGEGSRHKHAGSWFLFGPSDQAVYPAFLNRHGSDYVTSGRITSLAISPDCTISRCWMWVGAAGGGVWRTDKALEPKPHWDFVSDGFPTNAIGSLTYDAAHDVLYAGTGELAASADSEAGMGIFKSTDKGETWTALGGNANFLARSVKRVVVDLVNDPSGNTIYVGSGRGVRGVSSVNGGADSFATPGAPGVGLWKSTDGGVTFTLLAPGKAFTSAGVPYDSSFSSTRGVTDIEIDPTHPGVIYAATYAKGVWRSNDNGATWTNIHPFQISGSSADRSEMALATTPDGHTRMYQTEGDHGPTVRPPQPYSRLYVADAVETGAPVFVQKTSSNPADPGYATYNFCTGQCWYDQGIVSPPGNPDVVYVFGSYLYNEAGGISNARGLLLSTDGGNTFTDLTEDATSPTAPNGLHPDQHFLVSNPNNPFQYWEGSDGGLVRSDGTFTDTSSRCDSRGLDAVSLARCKQLLSRVPTRLDSLNTYLSTLQFQSVSVSPFDAGEVQGGTQDNGTFENYGKTKVWPQTIFGDGGQSGFDVGNPHFRFHTYFAPQVDVSFADGAPPSWDWIADPLVNAPEQSSFYIPIINDPKVGGTMFAGLSHVWRTQDDGGPQAYLDEHCNEFTGDGKAPCGDWVKVGPDLTAGAPGSYVAAVERAPSDTGTLWAATLTGRVFVSKNADAAAAAVAFTRIDSTDPNAPNRFVSGIAIDPANANHAFISYSGYSSNTPLRQGHVFSVTYNPLAGTATWTRLDGGPGGLADLPVTDVAYDDVTGDLYASTDFGVLRLPAGDTTWVVAGSGLPNVEVAGLTIVPKARVLYAATHGRSVWAVSLADKDDNAGKDNGGDNGKKNGGGKSRD